MVPMLIESPVFGLVTLKLLPLVMVPIVPVSSEPRSEERRVGKEGKLTRWLELTVPFMVPMLIESPVFGLVTLKLLPLVMVQIVPVSSDPTVIDLPTVLDEKLTR